MLPIFGITKYAETPQRKALMICQEIAWTSFGTEFNSGSTLPLDLAKKIAYSMVDEVLKEMGNWGGYEVECSDENGKSCSPNDRIEYWTKVRDEISKL